jgi:hypothetical protein
MNRLEVIPGHVRRKVLDVHQVFLRAGVPHALGGAVAFGYAGTPRGTLDVDVDVFVAPEAADRVIGLLTAAGAETVPEWPLQRVEREGQTRLLWEDTAIDLFFMAHELYDSVRDRVVVQEFDGVPLPVLSPGDIVLFKALFNRSKDWADIESVLALQGRGFDLEYVVDTLQATVGPDDSRIARVQSVADEVWARTGHVD